MEKFVKIEIKYDKEGNETVLFTTKGFKESEYNRNLIYNTLVKKIGIKKRKKTPKPKKQ